MTAMVLELKPKDFMKLREREGGGGARERDRGGPVCARMRKKCIESMHQLEQAYACLSCKCKLYCACAKTHNCSHEL